MNNDCVTVKNRLNMDKPSELITLFNQTIAEYSKDKVDNEVFRSEMRNTIWSRLPLLNNVSDSFDLNLQESVFETIDDASPIISSLDMTLTDASKTELSKFTLRDTLNAAYRSTAKMYRVFKETYNQLCASEKASDCCDNQIRDNFAAYLNGIMYHALNVVRSIDYLIKNEKITRLEEARLHLMIDPVINKHIVDPLIVDRNPFDQSIFNDLALSDEEREPFVYYTCQNDIELLAALGDEIISRGIQIRRCPQCDTIFLCVPYKRKYCSYECRRQASNASKSKYQSDAVIKAYRNAYFRIKNPANKKHFSADVFCHEENPLFEQIEAAIDLGGEKGIKRLLKLLRKLKEENMKKVVDPEDPFTEEAMIDWLEGIRAK